MLKPSTILWMSDNDEAAARLPAKRKMTCSVGHHQNEADGGASGGSEKALEVPTILFRIFDILHGTTTRGVARVCQRWRDKGAEEKLWQRKCLACWSDLCGDSGAARVTGGSWLAFYVRQMRQVQGLLHDQRHSQSTGLVFPAPISEPSLASFTVLLELYDRTGEIFITSIVFSATKLNHPIPLDTSHTQLASLMPLAVPGPRPTDDGGNIFDLMGFVTIFDTEHSKASAVFGPLHYQSDDPQFHGDSDIDVQGCSELWTKCRDRQEMRNCQGTCSAFLRSTGRPFQKYWLNMRLL
jgi:hypothetical protein